MKLFKYRSLKAIGVTIFALNCGAQMIWGATAKASIEPSTRIFKKGDHQLIVYSDVP